MAIRVTAPNRGFTGRINGDSFYRGVCDDATEANLPYYLRQGYLIGDAADLPSAVMPEQEPEPADEPEPVTVTEKPKVAVSSESPKRNAPRGVWAKFLTEQGLDAAENASRDDLIKLWEQSQ